MRTPATSVSAGPDAFLRDATEFRLGDLVTEASHPRSTHLSDTARRDAAEGLAVLFDVDRDVVDTFDRWSRGVDPVALRDLVVSTLRAGGRVFFTGCGATGRLSIQLNAIWRSFWQQRRDRGELWPSPDDYEHRTFSVMAGGDYALIKSVEGFEDFAPFGRRQVAGLGLAAGDLLFAITEGGETSFVIGTAWEALDRGARTVFVYNNPDDLLRAHVTRSREVIDEPRIRKVNLTTGPMAITGSTRMQATSIELLVMTTVLEMAARDLVGGDSGAVPGEMRAGLAALHAELAGAPLRAALARLVEAEEAVYRRHGRTSYFADTLGVDVLTDTTERSPTFCTPSFRKWDDTGAAESWAFLFTPAHTTPAAWTRLLRRPPQTVEWNDDDLKELLDPEGALRQSQVLKEIGLRELHRFRVGLDGRGDRPPRPGDGATAVVTALDAALLEAGGTFTRDLRAAANAGAAAALVAVGRRADLDRLLATDGARACGGLTVALPVAGTPFLLDPLTRIGAKLLLNALSTCVMVRLGRVLGNRMIWVVPSNLKLIDRSVRYIRDLAGVSYEQACRTLFEVIDYVEPRRRAGRVYPAPVGVATMRLRHGLDLPAAEARLFEELG